MFLAHFSNASLDSVLEWDTDKIEFWYEYAVELHNELNKREQDG